MTYYSAKELVDCVNEKYPEAITVRRIRTLRAEERISELEKVNGRMKYSDLHLKEVEAIVELERIGKKKNEIQKIMTSYVSNGMTYDDVLSDARNYETETMLNYRIFDLGNGVKIQFEKEKFKENEMEHLKTEVENMIRKYKGD